MKRLFDLEVIEGNHIRARPSEYLRSLTPERQREEVTGFLHWAENEQRSSEDPRARAEAGIGVATAREFLAKLEKAEAVIYTGAEDKRPS